MKKIILSLIGAAVAVPSFADISNAMYGYVDIVNDSSTAAFWLQRDDNLTAHGVFLSGFNDGEVRVGPKETKRLYYQTDWGMHAAGKVEAGARCEASFDAEASIEVWSLFLDSGASAKAKFSSQASCNAALSAEASAYTGLFPTTTMFIKLSGDNEACGASGGSITLDYSTTTSLAVSGQGGKADSASTICTYSSAIFKYHVINDRPEPQYMSYAMPVTTVHLDAGFYSNKSKSKVPAAKVNNQQIRVIAPQ